ncbi:protein-methionine-sulfoxide reductase catalytic subunit MsrP [Limnobacter humi]|uniref:Protein-methionine-sulfoxide reductase catalytic subunit MsrP n=1 Tax=Limnobacter humi TaxID=1778671 RepID=A0ABT1WCR8_9BURK|nr:protein-methionine-sulfoxide reductase catalytic subunit MsrP [Limnobacter humi]MCQ8895318.1 protein-methionine-sulfoxide reductase catalytic subunit MsrP [Limnobacter humi]
MAFRRSDWDKYRDNDVTPEAVFNQRRKLIQALGAGSVAGPLEGLAAAGRVGAAVVGALGAATVARAEVKIAGSVALAECADLPATKNNRWATLEKVTDSSLVTTYNNFYEFGTDKSDPARHALSLKTRPWSVVVEGECNRPRTFAIEDLLKLAPMEERIYKFRCVEAWSVVVPWIGYPLSRLLKAVEPNSRAKFVAFETLADPQQMPGLRSPVLDWPYKEGLRMDEAMHELALLTFGQYGKVLPNQSGAPIRMVLPWKYGFKSIKSIVRIRLTEKQPPTSWNDSAPREYGFFSNVNPMVDHPRWSQATERRLGEGALGGLFAPRRKTELFNGYAEAVQGLYAGLDLKKWF